MSERINELLAAYNEKKITLEQFKDELLSQGWAVLDEEKIYPVRGGLIMGFLDLVSRFITKETELRKILDAEIATLTPLGADFALEPVYIDSLRAQLIKRLILLLDRKG